MKLGTGLFTAQRRPDDDRSPSERYAEWRRLTREIEDAGLDSAWVSEHHFTEDEYLSGTMPTLGAMAAETDDIEIGTSVALAPLYDAIRLVEDAATVDVLSDGRASLGLSIGYRDAEFANFGIPKDERTDRLEETVELAKGIWSHGSVPFDPEYHPIEAETPVTPIPPEGGPPILLGGAAKPAVRRAARLADGWIAPSSLDLEGLRVRIEDIRRVREEAGLDDPFDIYVLRHGFVADSSEAAWEAMRPGYFYLQRRYAEFYGEDSDTTLSTERKRELKSQAIFGPPEDVTAELTRFGDTLGTDIHCILRTYFPGTGTERMVSTIHRLGDEVAPALP